MRLFIAALSFIPFFAFAQEAPDLSTKDPLDLLHHKGIEQINGNCFEISNRMCTKNTDAFNCVEDEDIERRASIKLKEGRFKFYGKNFNTLAYTLKPTSSKIKEEELYTQREKEGNKVVLKPAHLRLFVLLKQTACPVKPIADKKSEVVAPHPVQHPTAPPKAETIKKDLPSSLDNISIKPSPEANRKALEFLTNIPLKHK